MIKKIVAMEKSEDKSLLGRTAVHQGTVTWEEGRIAVTGRGQ